jgi:Cof subfamily protein (haloacid dehalogenase superfamily)
MGNKEKNMYKLAVLDIDGTLLDSKGCITKKTLQTIRAVEKQGGIVTICTGRNIRKSLPVVKKSGIQVPFACIDGTLLFDPIKRTAVHDLPLSREEIHFILDAAVNEDAFVEVNNGQIYYKFAKKEPLYQYDIFNKRTFLGRIKSYHGGVRYVKKFDIMRTIPDPVYQIVIAAEPEITKKIKDTIIKFDNGQLEIRDNLWEKYLFISRKGATKSMAMERLCNYFQVPMEKTIAIGDEQNDIDMLEKAGMGIAMGNASENVKAVADYITLSNDADGVADALQKFFLR